MNISMKTAKYAILALVLCAGLASVANALTIGDSNELGFVTFGIPSGDSDRTAYVNHLKGMVIGTSDTFLGNGFQRSLNVFAPLDTAVFALNGTSTTINLGTGGYMYLFAKYDGPNYGSEVWYINGMTGNITIPADAGSAPYGLSGWTLFTPGTPSVPDGGATLMLLGSALAGLGAVRRFLKK
jgi:hypothetical protein